MNKQVLIKELNYIENIILHYFNKNGSKYLDILDGDSRKYVEDYDGYTFKGYTGVTVKYLREYLFNKKYSKSMISYVLLKLLSEGNIQTLFCCDIEKVIFEPIESSHGTNYFINNYDEDEAYDIENISYKKYKNYKPLIKSYYAISNYLNK